jgi:hypothetical protein
MGRGASYKNIKRISGLRRVLDPRNFLVTNLLSPTLSSGFARKRGRRNRVQAMFDSAHNAPFSSAVASAVFVEVDGVSFGADLISVPSRCR